MLTQTSRWSCPVVGNPAESGCMRLGVYTWAAGTGRECIAVSVNREARPPCCPQLCCPRPALWSAGERLLGRAESAGAQAPVTSVDVLLGDGKGSDSRLPARLPLLRSVLGRPLQLPHSEVSPVFHLCAVARVTGRPPCRLLIVSRLHRGLLVAVARSA